MANVKITELTELSAANLAAADVLPIVDVGADQTKKATKPAGHHKTLHVQFVLMPEATSKNMFGPSL